MSDNDDNNDTPVTAHLPADLKELLDKLHSAIIVNDVKLLENEIFRDKRIGQVINEIDDNGFAAIHRAVRKEEQLPCLLSLIRKSTSVNVNLDVLGLDKETAFFMAVHNNNIKAANALIEAGSRAVNQMCGPSENRKESPLHVAVKFGYEEMVVFLLKNRAEINSRDGFRQTPLHIASKHNRPQLVYVLLSAGANPTPQDIDGKDALYVASENRHIHCVTLLKSEKKYLNDAMSQVRAEMKVAKPSVHSSDQLVAMLQARKQKEEEEERAAQALLEKDAEARKKKEAAEAAEKKRKEQEEIDKKNKEKAEEEKRQREAAIAAAHYTPVPSMATRTHDPLTGKKLPICKTLEEVGPSVPQEVPKQPPIKNAQEGVGGTRMIVGAGLPDDVKEKVTGKNRPMMFVEQIGSVPDS